MILKPGFCGKRLEAEIGVVANSETQNLFCYRDGNRILANVSNQSFCGEAWPNGGPSFGFWCCRKCLVKNGYKW